MRRGASKDDQAIRRWLLSEEQIKRLCRSGAAKQLGWRSINVSSHVLLTPKNNRIRRVMDLAGRFDLVLNLPKCGIDQVEYAPRVSIVVGLSTTKCSGPIHREKNRRMEYRKRESLT